LAITIICLNQALILDGKVRTDVTVTNSQLLAEVMIQLEELLPSARIPLKKVRKAVAELTSDVLIRDTPNKLKSRIPIRSQASYESKGS